jgi:hypothetical protein
MPYNRSRRRWLDSGIRAVPPRVPSGRSPWASDQPAKSSVSQRCCWSYTTAIPARLNRVLIMFW